MLDSQDEEELCEEVDVLEVLDKKIENNTEMYLLKIQRAESQQIMEVWALPECMLHCTELLKRYEAAVQAKEQEIASESEKEDNIAPTSEVDDIHNSKKDNNNNNNNDDDENISLADSANNNKNPIENSEANPENILSSLFPMVGFDRGLEPEKILGVSNIMGQLYYLMKWKGFNFFDIVSREDANEKSPQQVIEFHQERIKWMKTE